MSVVAKSNESADPIIAYTSEVRNVRTLKVKTQNLTINSGRAHHRAISPASRAPEGANAPFAGMLGAPEVLTFGQNFIRAFGGKRAIDVGTFTGASALAWALAVPEDGEVFTFDIDHTNYRTFGVPILSKCPKTFQKIQAVEGPALENLDKLIAEGQAGTFDFAFIDADKVNYSNYYDRAVTLLKKGGVIFVDNSLWRGSVCKPETRNDESCKAIHEMNVKVYHDDRTYSALLNLDDGTHVAFKK